jgi:hypothetical protein
VTWNRRYVELDMFFTWVWFLVFALLGVLILVYETLVRAPR